MESKPKYVYLYLFLFCVFIAKILTTRAENLPLQGTSLWLIESLESQDYFG